MSGPARPRPPTRHPGFSRRRLLNAVSVTALLLTWYAITKARLIHPFLLSSPAEVLQEAWDLTTSGVIFYFAGVSLLRVLEGFLLGAVLAVPLGILIGRIQTLHDLCDPILELARPIPALALIPLAIAWFGIGELSKVFLIAYAAFFPILINVIAGFHGVDPIHIRAARSLRASELQIFRDVVLMSAFPHVVAGLRIGMGMAFLVLVAAELIASNAGLGYLIQEARLNFHTPRIFVGIIAIGLLGYSLKDASGAGAPDRPLEVTVSAAQRGGSGAAALTGRRRDHRSVRRDPMRRHHVIIAVVLLALAGLGRPATAVIETADISMGVSQSPQLCAQIVVALEQGLFKQEGINPQIRWTPSGREFAEAFASRAVVMGTSGEQPAINLQARNLPVRIFAQLSEMSASLGVVVKQEIARPEDLHGRKVAFFPGTTSELLFQSFVRRYKLDAVKMQQFHMDMAESVAAFTRGDVDAIFGWEPSVTRAVEAGGRVLASGSQSLVPGQEGPHRMTPGHGVFSINTDFAKDNPRTVRAVLKILAAANEYLQDKKNVATVASG